MKVSGTPFQVDRDVLVSRSNYFNRMLSGNFREAAANEITLQQIPADYFRLLMDIIYRRPYIPSLGAMWLISYFDVQGEDLNAIHRKISVDPNKFDEYLNYLSLIYPNELDQEVLDIIASKLRYNTDLSRVDPEMIRAIKESKEYRYTGYNNVDKVIDDLYEEALSKMDSPLKYYKLRLPPHRYRIEDGEPDIGPYLVSAHSEAEAFLKWDRLLRDPEFRSKINSAYFNIPYNTGLVYLYLETIDPNKKYTYETLNSAAKIPRVKTEFTFADFETKPYPLYPILIKYTIF